MKSTHTSFPLRTRTATIGALLLIVVAVSTLVVGCRVPRVRVRQQVERVGEFSVGRTRVVEYRARDFMRVDSTDRLWRYEYLPVTLFTILDERDSVRYYVVSGWQEYLWRFSERLTPVDKQYYVPVPLSIDRTGDSALIVWGYPQIEGRDRDLRDVDKRRNDYWTVDLFTPSGTAEELFNGVLKSYPQIQPYEPLRRFLPEGSYKRALVDSAMVNGVARARAARIAGGKLVDTSGGR